MTNLLLNSANLWSAERTDPSGLNARTYRYGKSNRGVLVEWKGSMEDVTQIAVQEIAWLTDDPKWVHLPLFPLISEKTERVCSTVDEVNAILDKAAECYGGESERAEEPTPDRANPEQHYGRPYKKDIEDIVAQVIDQIGRNQIIAESLSRKVYCIDERLSALIGYMVSPGNHNPQELLRRLSHAEWMTPDDPDPDKEPPLVQTGPGGDFTRDYTPGKNVDVQA